MSKALVEEVTLMAEDLRGNLVNGLLALMDATDEKFATANLVTHIIANLTSAL
jgi:hypothetical protein